MINRVSKSYFTSAAVAALFLLASGDFAAAQGPGSAPRRNIDSAGGTRPLKNPPQQILTDGTWNIDAAGVWSLATNWLGNNIADGAASTGNFTFNITTNRTITLDSSRTLGIMNIGDSTGGPSNYTIAGASTLTFDNGGSNAQLNETSTSGNNTISAPIALNGSLDITNASGSNLTLSGGITAGTAGTKTITTSTGTVTASSVAIGDGSGVIALAQNGPGTLALGTVANTYSGGTTISGGKVTIGGTGTPLGSGGLTLSGGTLVSSASRSATATNVIVTADSALTTSSGAGTVNMPFSGTLTGTGGTLTIRNDGTATAGLFDVRFSGGDYSMSRPIILDNGATGGTARLSDFNATGSTHTYTGVISGNGAYNRSVSSGTGGTTVFTAANTYTGTTTVNSGTLQLGNGGATGSLSTSSAIIVNTAGTFAINRSNSVTQGTDFSGAAISGAGKFLDIGTGTVTLNVANTYSGGTTLSSGPFTANGANGAHAPSGSAPFLVATADGALGTGNVNLASSGVELTLSGGTTNNYISDNRTLSLVTGTTVNLNFTGTPDTINSLVYNGVAQVAGLWGSAASGAPNVLAEFIGAGEILVLIPEPSTWAMTIVGAGLLLSVQRFRRKKSLR